MGYVMVPVPEEHVEEAMSLILRITARARQLPWDTEALEAVFEHADEPTKSVLSAVARSTLSGTIVSDHSTADAIELPQRELLGIVRELNERAIADSRPPLIIVRQENEVLPNGRTREQRMLSMDHELATMVRDVERAELAANPHPLLSGDG